eukprot:TRINITY_DN40549_c0_g1_i2.p1 TRINITY_DN40549_c0_g1~~TRINITY_DN40549_c0_g1_i2.p1  ORF type:complete len:222 (+),score=54.05 TRINITY_DN40549_c0_g1_i2:212-877(+)
MIAWCEAMKKFFKRLSSKPDLAAKQDAASKAKDAESATVKAVTTPAAPPAAAAEVVQPLSPPTGPGTDPVIYWELQGPGDVLCGVHCLNSLLQYPWFTAEVLTKIAQDLDKAEAALGVKGSGAEGWKNMLGAGNFSGQVLLTALESIDGVSTCDVRHESVRDAALARPEEELGFICNRRKHWLALRKLRWQGDWCWFDLNSRLPHGPQHIAHSQLKVGQQS